MEWELSMQTTMMRNCKYKTGDVLGAPSIQSADSVTKFHSDFTVVVCRELCSRVERSRV